MASPEHRYQPETDKAEQRDTLREHLSLSLAKRKNRGRHQRKPRNPSQHITQMKEFQAAKGHEQ